MEALIVTGSDKSFSVIADVVRATGDYDIVRANSGVASRRVFSTRDFDLAIIGGIPDENGKNLASFLAENGTTGVILIEDSFVYEEVAAKLCGQGVIVLPRPLSRSLLVTGIRMVEAANARVQNLKRANVDLSREVEDMRLINRAKYVLIESLGYTENRAHKFIEKRAMDERKTRREIALEILKTYEI